MGIYNRCNRCNPKYRAPPKKELSMEGQKPGYKSYKKACSSMFSSGGMAPSGREVLEPQRSCISNGTKRV